MTEPTLTKERRAELRELLAKASPGPWKMYFVGDQYPLIIAFGENVPEDKVEGEHYVCQFPMPWMEAETNCMDNAELTIAVRNDLTALLDAIDAKDAELAALRADNARRAGSDAFEIYRLGYAAGEWAEPVREAFKRDVLGIKESPVTTPSPD